MLKSLRVTLNFMVTIVLLGVCACSGDSGETETGNAGSKEQTQEPRRDTEDTTSGQEVVPRPGRTGGADAAVSRMLAQPFDLRPRCRRGDNQEMVAEVLFHYLDSEGMIKSVKRNEIQYDQLCLHNSPDSLVYQIQIDTLKLGAKLPAGSRAGRHSVPTDFEGYSFELQFGRQMETRDDCYAHDVTLAEHMRYTQGYEFLSMFIPIELLEQLRYTAAARLRRIGDTLTIALPGPICYEVPQVIKQFRLERQPYRLTFSGITQYGRHACAIIEMESEPSPLSIEFAATEGTWTGSGSTWLTGNFLVALDNGDIVSATVRERMVASQKYPDESTAPNPVMFITKLHQVN
jgi:hypothetical protein